MDEYAKPFGADDAPAPLAQMGYASPISPQGPPLASTGKRALMLADTASAARSGPTSSRSAPSASAAPSSPSPVTQSVPQAGNEAEFEERFQERLAQFLQEHMDPPDAHSDAALPRYPG
jgi:hypothetical protein